MKKQILIVLVAAISSSTVFAEGLFNTSGKESGTIYGGASAGKADAECSDTSIDCKSTGWKLFGGYKLSPNLAVEGGYYSLGTAKEEVQPGTTAEVSASGVGMTGVASYPVADEVDMFAKGGIMMWEAEGKVTGFPTQKEDGTDLLLGVGAAYKLDNNWGIRGEYEHVGGDLKANMYSIGATFSSL